ncbi:MAG: hypothetical protein GY841_15670 [FCB group bacterium]|nr:hypothetical protein [FCB group bacterium]
MPTFCQIDLMFHTLGGNASAQWNRNHFAASPGHNDYEDLEILEKNGYMERIKSPPFMPETSITFIVTEKGKVFLRQLEQKGQSTK